MSEALPPTREADTALLRSIVASGLTLRLFVNRPAIGYESTASDFVEASFPGYAPVDLPASVWSIEPGRGKVRPAAYAPFQDFRRTQTGTSQDVYGWYLTDGTGVARYAVYVSEGPWEMKRGVDVAQIRPVLLAPAKEG